MQNKLRVDLVPPEVREIFALVCEAGIKQGYGERSWEDMKPEDNFASLERHEIQMLKGIELDEQSGLPHIYHMAWRAMAAAVLYKRNKQNV